MATLRELKGRIGSVASSEKITGAMKMISSAKMHKAEGELHRQLPFRNQIEAIIGNLLSADAQFSSPLMVPRPVQRVVLVVFGSDDGLCGAYNVNIAKFVASHIAQLRQQYGPDVHIDICPVGSKMEKATRKLAQGSVAMAYDVQASSKSDGDEVTAANKQLVDMFVSGRADRVDLVYMNFISLSRQRPRADQILPIQQQMFAGSAAKASGRPYIFEPSADAIFKAALPMFMLATLNEVFCENRVSEQAARVMAMQSANDNAKKLLEQLQLEYNKLRQQSITNELLDIVGGQIKN